MVRESSPEERQVDNENGNDGSGWRSKSEQEESIAVTHLTCMHQTSAPV